MACGQRNLPNYIPHSPSVVTSFPYFLLQWVCCFTLHEWCNAPRPNAKYVQNKKLTGTMIISRSVPWCPFLDLSAYMTGMTASPKCSISSFSGILFTCLTDRHAFKRLEWMFLLQRVPSQKTSTRYGNWEAHVKVTQDKIQWKTELRRSLDVKIKYLTNLAAGKVI